MKNSSIYAAVIDGQTVSGVTNFRYGQQIGETRVFEFRFKPQQTGADFNRGAGELKRYEGERITLMLSGALGKSVEQPGTITKIDYQRSPGYEAEVFVTGTVNAPSGRAAKFYLLLVGVILLPLLLGAYFVLRVNNLKHHLVSKTGQLETLHQHFAKGANIYTFKLKEYPAFFYRRYESTPGHLGWPDIKAITGDDLDDFKKDSVIHPVEFYILATDETKMGDAKSKLLFFNIKSKGHAQASYALFNDLLEYVVNRWDAFLIRMLALFAGVALYTGAYYCYKTLAPDGNLKYAIPYWGALGIALVLYLFMMLL